jgi:glycosyltransferase involved in cell wall biosynthesis
LKILHVDHSPVLGGAERSVLELALAQMKLGHLVTVAVGRSGAFSAALTEAGVRWRDLAWSERYVTASRTAAMSEILNALPDVARAAQALRRLVKNTRPDVVQAHTRKSQLVASLALVGFDVSLVWHLRDDLPARRPLQRAIAWALGRADHAVALSEWLVASYASRGALPRSRYIGIVPSGVDSTRLSQLPTPWLDGQHDPIVGYVGQIARWKAPHLLIDAAELLSHVPGTFRLIGDVWFPASEAAYGQRLRQKLSESSARDRVEWRVATKAPEEAFAGIDVLVHTSVEPEPFGRVLVEAMAARRPVVALRLGSVAELLDPSTAVFAERPDGAALAAAVERLLSDPHAARAMAERAAQRAVRYEPSAVAARMDAEYARLGR